MQVGGGGFLGELIIFDSRKLLHFFQISWEPAVYDEIEQGRSGKVRTEKGPFTVGLRNWSKYKVFEATFCDLFYLLLSYNGFPTHPITQLMSSPKVEPLCYIDRHPWSDGALYLCSFIKSQSQAFPTPALLRQAEVRYLENKGSISLLLWYS